MAQLLLALDQAAKISGATVFDKTTEKPIDILTWTIKDKGDMGQRLHDFLRELNKVYKQHPFTELVFEDIQLQAGNVKTFKTLAYIQATIILWCAKNEIPYTIMSPSHWRKVLKEKYDVTWGRSRKEQKAAAQELVKQLTNQDFTEDECDSFCIGLAYLAEQGKAKSAF